MKSISAISALLIISASPGIHAGNNYCGDLKNAFGPFDYTSVDGRKHLEIVETHHFAPYVEQLVKGQTTSVPAPDLDYTLRAFPNHHRALAAMANLAIRDKAPRPYKARYSTECYFVRAMRFKPDDGVVRMVYGNYLSRIGKREKALEQLKEAVRLDPENSNIQYSLGVFYLKQGDYEQAKAHADRAYELGYPLPWLRDKLAEAGKWHDRP